VAIPWQICVNGRSLLALIIEKNSLNFADNWFILAGSRPSITLVVWNFLRWISDIWWMNNLIPCEYEYRDLLTYWIILVVCKLSTLIQGYLGSFIICSLDTTLCTERREQSFSNILSCNTSVSNHKKMTPCLLFIFLGYSSHWFISPQNTFQQQTRSTLTRLK